MPGISVSVGIGIGAGGGDSLLLPVDQSLVIAQWVADSGVAGSASAVTSWTDIVNSNAVSESTDTPTLVSGATPSGRPAIRFDGSADLLRQAAFDLSAYQDVDLWVVMKRTTTGAVQNIVDCDGTVRTLLAANTTDTIDAHCRGNAGGDVDRDSSTTRSASWFVWNVRSLVSNGAGADDGQGYYGSGLTRFDTHVASVDNTDANQGSCELTFGERASASGGGNNFGGDIWCVAVTDTSADRTAIAQFLADKSGAS